MSKWWLLLKRCGKFQGAKTAGIETELRWLLPNENGDFRITHVEHVTSAHVEHVTDTHVGHMTGAHVAHVTPLILAVLAMQLRQDSRRKLQASYVACTSVIVAQKSLLSRRENHRSR